jgi:hypothetical protein
MGHRPEDSKKQTEAIEFERGVRKAECVKIVQGVWSRGQKLELIILL